MKKTEENVEIVDICREEERHLAAENHFNKFVFNVEDFERISNKNSSRRKT